MDKDYFMNAGISPWSGLNDHSFLDPNSSMDQYPHFDPNWGPMVSAPATTSALSNDAFALRQLIGKLGSAGNSTAFPPPAAAASPFPVTNNNGSNGGSCRTPLSSPKLSLPILDQINIPNMGNSMPLTPPLPSLSADPGFAERAAKFSCFGSRSFNGRTSQFGPNNGELGRRSSPPLVGDGKLHRVSSSPILKQDGSPLENRPVNGAVLGSDKKVCKFPGSGANSNEESSVSEQIPSGETGSKTSNELNPRKRKANNRGKTKDDSSNSAKGAEGDDDANAKRLKTAENGKNETRTEEETKGGSNDESDKQKTNQKPPEAPKDYIHVRARRGQATDSHSLAERVRREKISERMKLLQDLVPGCNKVTGKALMLDEIINYVQSLQRQVEFLSMKLASVNPELDFNMENLLSKDMFQPNTTLPQQMYPLDSSGPAFYHHQPPQTVPMGQSPVDPLPFDGPSCRNLGIQLPSVDGFNENLPQFQPFSEDDLHSIVQMGFVQNPISFSVQNQASNMKVEL